MTTAQVGPPRWGDNLSLVGRHGNRTINHPFRFPPKEDLVEQNTLRAIPLWEGAVHTE
jgi:hypothetical protein